MALLKFVFVELLDGWFVFLCVVVDWINAEVVGGKQRHVVQVDVGGKVSDFILSVVGVL